MSKHAPPYPNAATDPFNQLPGMNRPTKTMTAEPDLLPLPGWTEFTGLGDLAADYARACVSSATEALRAEVAAAIGEAMQSRADAKEWQGAAEIYRGRAERLAEALRRMTGLALEVVPALEATRVNVSLAADVKQAADAARAALDQETTNG